MCHKLVGGCRNLAASRRPRCPPAHRPHFSFYDSKRTTSMRRRTGVIKTKMSICAVGRRPAACRRSKVAAAARFSVLWFSFGTMTEMGPRRSSAPFDCVPVRTTVHPLPAHGYGLCSYGLYNHGLYDYSYGIYSYGLCSYGLYGYGTTAHPLPAHP